MRSRLPLFASFVLVLCLSLLAPVAYGETTILVPWVPGDPLTWEDFQGTPPTNAAQQMEAAFIVTTIKMSAGTYVDQNGSSGHVGFYTDIVVANYMNPDKSWVLSSAACAHLLAHEQGHFDLSEAYRRKAVRMIEATRLYGSDPYAVQQQLYDRFTEIRNEIEVQASCATNRYDEETNHGLDTAQQARWFEQIEAWLEHPESIPHWDS